MKDRSTFVAAALGLTFFLAFAADAVAQPAEQPEPTEAGSAMPEHGFAPPSDEVPPTGEPKQADEKTDPVTGHDQNTGVGTGATVHEEGGHDGGHHGAHDPTKTFNWFKFGYGGKDEYGGKLGDGQMVDAHGNVVKDSHGATAAEEPMPAPYIAALINFLILIGILLWKGRPVATQMAAERHDQIKSALEEAAKLRQQAADKLAEYEQSLKKSDAEIKTMVEGIRASAEADKIRILENATRAAAQMQKDAEARIAAEIELARARLTREVTYAAAAATEKLLKDKLLPTDQQKLVGSFITDLGQAQAPSSRERS